MRTAASPSLNARKSPRQDRSVATVDAIFEATLQVLQSDGVSRLTTTRVAQRAGVSVGTLYQYFPNKQALLFAVLDRQLSALTNAIETACGENQGISVTAMAGVVVRAYLKAILAHAELSPALYLITVEIDARELIEAATLRSVVAIEGMLTSASDGRLKNPNIAAHTMTAVIFGTVPAFCKRVLSPALGNEAEKQLTIMFRSYLVASCA